MKDRDKQKWGNRKLIKVDTVHERPEDFELLVEMETNAEEKNHEESRDEKLFAGRIEKNIKIKEQLLDTSG